MCLRFSARGELFASMTAFSADSLSRALSRLESPISKVFLNHYNVVRVSDRGPSADQLFAAQLQTIQMAENRNRD